ncbi:RHS repeat domain-containing protein [Chryseobacterium soldanellicola]|uniref:RHS repeat domain-containing protein n=1 Tax=Chryseobacterium soldanellicola TaxID=311333 RepID=UPI000B7EF296
MVSQVLKFVPTSEGYFNFENNKYIYNYVDHLGNVRISYFNNGSGAEVLEENNYYPFGLKHEGYNALAGNPTYNYKYNGKELQQESGMYDYGARFYMPDIGRWGVVDPRSQYTHEAYNYVWNNPISFNDPTGMEGELGFPIRDGLKDGEVWHDSDGLFTWNAKKGTWIDANNKSAVITQVSILNTKNSNNNNGQYATATALGLANGENPGGWAILVAVGALWFIDQATKPSYEWFTPAHTTIADPGAGMRNLNSDSESEEDKDVNGVKVPQEGKPDARYEPKDLQEQLSIEEAESGEGDTIMTGKLKDPKYNHNTKMKHTHDHGDGTKTEVHYDINNQTGKRSGFKIKDGTNAKSRGHRYP